MQRRDRWDNREYLKEQANRNGSLARTHPQARRGIEEAMNQVEEWEMELPDTKASDAEWVGCYRAIFAEYPIERRAKALGILRYQRGQGSPLFQRFTNLQLEAMGEPPPMTRRGE